MLESYQVKGKEQLVEAESKADNGYADGQQKRGQEKGKELVAMIEIPLIQVTSPQLVNSVCSLRECLDSSIT